VEKHEPMANSNRWMEKRSNQSVNQSGKTMRVCVKFSAGAKVRLPAGYVEENE